MEGQVLLRCRDCGRTASVAGEMPEEYSSCFVEVTRRDGWVVAPGARVELLCGDCLPNYKGSETEDDDEKLRRDGATRRNTSS
jgi:hypothetical protein